MNLKEKLAYYQGLLNNNKITHAEFCALMLLNYWFENKCQVGSKINLNIKLDVPSSKYLIHNDPYLKSIIKYDGSVIDFLNIYGIKHVSAKINSALIGWHNKSYPLVLCDYIPTPVEVLRLQCEGKRYVSFLTNQSDYTKPVEHKKNIFEFLIHDLEHADEFFKNPSERAGQINFYKTIKNAIDKNIFKENLNDPIFKKDLFYCISDMNSVPEHLTQYLRAKLIEHYKRTSIKQFEATQNESSLTAREQVDKQVEKKLIQIFG